MIFLDTGFLFAFVSEDDSNHSRVVEVLERYRGRPPGELLLTTCVKPRPGQRAQVGEA